MPANRYRILVVDDIPDNLFLLKTFLESEGYQVEVASSGKAALKAIQALRPDLVLLDVMMPDMNGYEVMQRLQQQDDLAAVPILLITAYGKGQVSQGLKRSVKGWVQKPIDFDDLLTRIREVLCNNSLDIPIVSPA